MEIRGNETVQRRRVKQSEGKESKISQLMGRYDDSYALEILATTMNWTRNYDYSIYSGKD